MRRGTFFDSEGDDELDKLVRSLMEKHKVHTVEYALIDDNKIKSVNTITDQDISSDALSLFQAASFSKSITTFAVVDLVLNIKFN
jgi:CubicO group peptidase (beta-lactamase class C family)